ncbi:hypothetical protein pb186bvf_006282 [Paramecium bursaria]
MNIENAIQGQDVNDDVQDLADMLNNTGTKKKNIQTKRNSLNQRLLVDRISKKKIRKVQQ